MKRLLIFVLFIGVEARAQSLADVARAERLRQQNIEAALKVQKFGDKPATPTEEAPKAEVAAQTPNDPPKEPTLEEKLRNERTDIIKQRSQLLVRMGELRHDPVAVKAIEAQLMELSKRAEAAKLQHLGKRKPNHN